MCSRSRQPCVVECWSLLPCPAWEVRLLVMNIFEKSVRIWVHSVAFWCFSSTHKWFCWRKLCERQHSLIFSTCSFISSERSDHEILHWWNKTAHDFNKPFDKKYLVQILEEASDLPQVLAYFENPDFLMSPKMEPKIIAFLQREV